MWPKRSGVGLGVKEEGKLTVKRKVPSLNFLEPLTPFEAAIVSVVGCRVVGRCNEELKGYFVGGAARLRTTDGETSKKSSALEIRAISVKKRRTFPAFGEVRTYLFVLRGSSSSKGVTVRKTASERIKREKGD